MKRRSFLAALLGAPITTLLPKMPQPTRIYGGVAAGAMASLQEALDKIVNPPVIVDNAGAVWHAMSPGYAIQYRQEFIEAFEQRESLLREVMEGKS